ILIRSFSSHSTRTLPSLSDSQKQPDGGKEKDEVREGSSGKQTECEGCDGDEVSQDQGIKNIIPKSFADIAKDNHGNADNTLSLIPDILS
ncbi:hypothetical protein Tco_0521405, partial [Tanacetum coccineum]